MHYSVTEFPLWMTVFDIDFELIGNSRILPGQASEFSVQSTLVQRESLRGFDILLVQESVEYADS